MIRVGIVIEDLSEGGAPANYAHALVGKLADHPQVQPVLFYCRGSPDGVPVEVETVARPDRPYPTPILPDRPQLPRLPQLEREHRIDIFHLNRIPDLGHWHVHRAETPVVATVHGTLHWEDIPVRSLPTGYRYRRRFFDRLGRYTLSQSFTVSEYVSRLLRERAGYPEPRVTCTYEAIDDAYFDLPPQDPPDDVPEEYLLHVSNQAPKKNLETVVRALPRLDSEISLVVTGRGWAETCGPLVSELGLEDRVQFRGFVPRSELVALYDNAACFVFPSYHETFGLPNVEAMARGAPVVTSETFAIPEIVQEGAEMFSPPNDAKALGRAIGRVRNDESRRKRLVEEGRERAAAFSWNAHLATLVSRYGSLL